MKKITVIYWSGTGNTEAMANAIAEGAKTNETEVRLISVGDASKEDIINSDVLALGCPSMGSEQLEEGEMEPFIDSISEIVSGKKLALFGSYGWGNGEWMAEWQERMSGYGAIISEEGLIINNEPDEDGIEKCNELGRILTKS